MSKQKCRISKKRSNFTIISNDVAQTLNNNLEALGLYVYLFSLPHDWEFFKSHLRKVCDIGEKKLNNLLKILSAHKLVNVTQVRKENGQFSHFDIDIDDGSAFIHTPQPDGQNCRTAENGGAVKQSYKEDIKAFKKEYKNQERESPARKSREPLSESFKPDQEREAIAKTVSSRCNIPVEDLLVKFKTIEKKKNRKELNWQLEFELFLAREKPSVQKYSNESKLNQEMKSTVLEYGPGHPTWEANQEWKRKQLKGTPHGSEITGNNTRGNGVQKVEGYLF